MTQVVILVFIPHPVILVIPLPVINCPLILVIPLPVINDSPYLIRELVVRKIMLAVAVLVRSNLR